jgi:hypothetical protein
VPESKSRKKKPAFQSEADRAAKAARKAQSGNPAWLVPVMLGLMLLGLAWIVVFYLTGKWPVPQLHSWNLAVGFVLIIAGFGLTTRWR